MYHDTHFHLDLCPNASLTAQKIEESKTHTIAVTNLPALFANTQTLCKGRKYLRPALGYHPELVAQYPGQLEQFKTLLAETRYVGEIGLDRRKEGADNFAKQKVIFEQILKACGEAGSKILTVHSRGAATDVISMIGNNFPGRIILHWYSGSKKELLRAVDYGFYFSVNHNMLKSEKGKILLDELPSDRILLETDGPFTKYGTATFSPLMINFVVSELEKLKGSIITEQLRTNFQTLLSDVTQQ